MTTNVEPTHLPALQWREFLTDHPPGTRAMVDRAAVKHHHLLRVVEHPQGELFLHCYANCNEEQFCRRVKSEGGHLFSDRPVVRYTGDPIWESMLPYDVIMSYQCETCDSLIKTYLLRFYAIAPKEAPTAAIEAQKIFEWPVFTPRTPAKLFRLGVDRDVFLQGRRAEIAGLGIGAFAYYRRVVEEHKNQLLAETIRVAEHLSAEPEVIDGLKRAMGEVQFSKAMDDVKDLIPEALFIRGYNPFTLLHAALSKGLHAESDEECLAASTDIRIVLTRMAENFTKAMDSEEELNEAVRRIVQKRQEKPESM